ncbi:NAD(P)-binding Rossmann-fold containing protein [Glarea lozoyensis ATCC 20868]|uniref:NAD(P)-binding Rossmann-fold containing protein n=1 Tax=Glarea lozoyensis (strain ATCC 20868 / MF5171) TaxID=1116229 RepID=S3CZL1_GLAL2|nr:NAD(P)-binding Rossmann-fold containing protein [Glarea lozoyensis ATCC 20868]EPE30319.1 NAD(P)-binding Rossmann-fold containing protein [Glarea lozoyensis ATCC 20868]
MQESHPDFYTYPFSFTKTLRRDPYPFVAAEKPGNSAGGKIIVVTGAGSGIGAAAAKVWARANATGIVIIGRRLPELEKVRDEIAGLNKETKVLVVSADISIEEDVKSLFAKIQDTFGRGADVLLNNASVLNDGKKFGEGSLGEWWSTIDINTKGTALMIHYYINSQPDPKNPVGTVICVLSARVGFTMPTGSGYNVSKMATQVLVEHVQAEYPTLRTFTTMPGVVLSDMTNDYWKTYAKDHADLTGLQALYLAQPRADYLKGLMVSVNWDLEVMEAHKEEIVEGKLLRHTWIASLPFYGGSGLGA